MPSSIFSATSAGFSVGKSRLSLETGAAQAIPLVSSVRRSNAKGGNREERADARRVAAGEEWSVDNGRHDARGVDLRTRSSCEPAECAQCSIALPVELRSPVQCSPALELAINSTRRMREIAAYSYSRTEDRTLLCCTVLVYCKRTRTAQ